MTGIFYLGQEDVDFSPFTPSSLTPNPIANTGAYARSESSPNVIACYSPIDRQALTSNIGEYNDSFDGDTLNDLWFSCRYYADGATGSTGGSVYSDYTLKFDNMPLSTFTPYSIMINPSGVVSLTDNSTTNITLTNTLGGTVPWISGALTKLDVHIVYGTSGTIDIYSADTHVYNYSGDLTSGAGAGSGFYNIDYGSAGGGGTTVATYFSEIIVSDTTDTRQYYMSTTLVDSGNTAYIAPSCDYSTNVVSSTNFDNNFNYPFSVEIPSYYIAGDIIYCGQSSIGANFAPSAFAREQFITWFSITNSGGKDIPFYYNVYGVGNPVAITSSCMPRTIASLTALNILTSKLGDTYPGDISTGHAPGVFGINKLAIHVAFGSGTPNPCITPVYTNIMFVT